MTCPHCTASHSLALGNCETALLDAVKTEFFRALAALPPHLQKYLGCRLGLTTTAELQSSHATALPLGFDVGRFLEALPAIIQLLIQLGLVRPPRSAPPMPQAATDSAWLRAVAAAAAAFAGAVGSSPAPTAPDVPLDPAGYSPRAVRRCA